MASLLSVRRGVGSWGWNGGEWGGNGGGVTGVRVTLMAVGAGEGLGIDLAGNGATGWEGAGGAGGGVRGWRVTLMAVGAGEGLGIDLAGNGATGWTGTGGA